MSRELTDLKSSLQAAEAAVASDLEHKHLAHTHAHAAQLAAMVVPDFPTSEVAVQAILECLRSHEFTKAVCYIQECRWGKLWRLKKCGVKVYNEIFLWMYNEKRQKNEMLKLKVASIVQYIP